MKDEKTLEDRSITRRDYLKTSVAGAAGLLLAPKLAGAAKPIAPMYVPARVLGRYSPSNTINIAQIGVGRIARDHDLPETLKEEGTRLVAAADVDLDRANAVTEWARRFYARPDTDRRDAEVDVRIYQDYREMLAAHPEIDAVIVSTPDHAHVLPVIEAAMLGKAIYMQKPHSLTVEEGRIMSDFLHRMGTIFSVGSQQRSTTPWPQFKQACEAVRNGRVGNLHTIRVGLPGDPPGGDPTPMPTPPGLDYDGWLGTTPFVPYTVDRVHPQQGYGRGGWLRCEQFSAGMITGWGAHHIDTAHWGMGTEYTGPIEIEADAEFATGGLWDVHGDFRVEAKYANGVNMIISGEFPNGIRFEGDEGWIFVTRSGGGVTASDPSVPDQTGPLQASSPALLSPLPADALRLYGEENEEHHSAWIRCIRGNTPSTAAPPEVSHRSTSACLISHIAMKLPRKLHWDPINERFRNDPEANSMLSRPQRSPYSVNEIPGFLAVR
jgi:myo-inositol 2-dehydrogenase / D-chiro-inositol 1-dehydrogenase